MNEKMEQYRVENIDTEANLRKKIKDVEPIESSGSTLLTKDTMKDYVEEPCLDACMYLYNLNIQTYMSSANKKNVGEFGGISIYFDDSLSDENKQIIQDLINRGNKNLNIGEYDVTIASIDVPITEETTVGEVKDEFMKIVSKLKIQDVLYGRFSREEVVEYIRDMAGCRDLDVDEETIKELGFCYCKEDDIYFKNEELLRKHLAYKEREQGQEL